MKAYGKAVLRAVGRSKGRFWAIFAIVALGAGFFAGLAATAPGMRGTVDAYLDGQRFMDAELVSTLGFSTADVQAVEKTDGVCAVQATWSSDILSRAGDRDVAMRVHALPESGGMNAPVLKAGRLPEKPGECALDTRDTSLTGGGYRIGGKIRAESGGDGLRGTEFTIVGFVESPLYLSFTLGNTAIGNGQLDHFLYVVPEMFDMDAYTALYVQAEGAAALDAFSDAYRDRIAAVTRRLEAVGEQRAPLRREEIVADARKELDAARAQYTQRKEDAQKGLAAAQQKLDAGRREIAENERKLAGAQEQLDSGAAQLAAARETYRTGLAQYQAQKAAAEEKLAQAQEQLDSGAAQLAAAQKELDEGKEQLAAQRKPLDSARAQLETQTQALSEKETALKSGEDQLAALAPQVEAARGALAQLEAAGMGATGEAETLRGQIAAFEDQQAKLRQAREQLDGAKGQLAQAQAAFDAQYAAAKPQLDAAQKELDSAAAQIGANEQQLDSARAAYARQKAAAQAEFDAAKAKLDSAQAQIAANEQKLAAARTQIAEGKAQLAGAKGQIESGQADYDRQKQDVEKQLADAEEQLGENQRKLDEVETPQWYVLDRSKNLGYNSFTSDADRMASLVTVFPVLFFLVAALVALTTMTRMVEEERGEIGAYKALGFSNRAIMAKYLFYGGLASVTGSAVGVCAGGLALPSICWNAYRIMYHAPAISPAVSPGISLASAGVSVALTLAATFAACRATLAEPAASLLLPKAPQAGKRIWLERVRPVWRRMKFSQKVTARNLFRYKKRLVMTVVGIAGCTSLMLMGFGIRDSVVHIVSNQFEDLYQYNMTVQIEDSGLSDGARGVLDDTSRVQRWMLDERRSADIENMDGGVMSGYVFIPEDAGALPELIRLRDRRTHEPVRFGKDSVVVTEKMASRLGLSVGSALRLKNAAGKRVQFTVTGITENYVYHYVYIDPALYARVAGEAPSYNEVCGRTAPGADGRALSDSLLAQAGVATVSYSDDAAANFNDMVKSLNSVIVVLIFFAGMLSFVVVYNLTNINITERERELATLRVLGFHNREAAGYIYRETALLTLMGCAAGLLLGVVLHRFVVLTVEVDICMFGRNIDPPSFLWSILLTLGFTLVVDLFMYRKFRKIDMVQSLKSVD